MSQCSKIWCCILKLRTHAAGRFARSSDGTIAVLAALALPCLMMVAGAAVDLGMYVSKRTDLQTAVDAAALSAARELPLANSSSAVVRAVAVNAASSYLDRETDSDNYKITVDVDRASGTVKVDVAESWSPAFAHLFSDVTPVIATATAQVVSSGKICALALHQSKAKTLFLDTSARIQADDCAVYANSSHDEAIRVDASASIAARMICSAGGFVGATSAFKPIPITDCPNLPDPLADRPLPPVGSCSQYDHVVKTGTVTLSPGVYCEGLKIEADAKVEFEPGIYVIKDGKFEVTGMATVKGIGVGFVLTGGNTLFEFTADTTIHLEGPTDGPMAGLLFYEDPDTASGKKYRINSNHADVLLGTFYIPKGTLLIDSKESVASASAYTAIIANSIELRENPVLVLNSDYESSKVPAPSGLLGGRIVLKR